MDGDNQPSGASGGADFFRNIYPNTLEAAPIEVATQSELPVQTQDSDVEYGNYHFDEAWNNLDGADQTLYQPNDAFGDDQLSDLFEEGGLDYTLNNEPFPASSLYNIPGNTSIVPIENDVVSPAQLVLTREQAQQQQRLIEQQQYIEVQQLIEQMRQRQQQQQQQQSQVNAFPATPQLNAFPVLEDSPMQSQLANQQQQQPPATPAQLQPNESPAQRPLDVSPAQVHSTEQQQPQHQMSTNSDAFIQSLSLINNRIRPLLEMSCRLVEYVNRVGSGNSHAEFQFLARLQVTFRLFIAVTQWRDLGPEHPRTKALQRVAEMPRTVNNIRFDNLLLMTLSVSHDFMDVIQNLQTEGFFERQHTSSAALRQAIVECHTEALNTFSSVLSILRHDRSLLPFAYGIDGAFVIMCSTNPPQNQEQRQTCPRGVACIINICTEMIYRQCSLVRLVVPEIPKMSPLPPQKQVRAISPENLQAIRHYQEQIQQILPPQLRLRRLESGPTTFSHATDEQIVFMEGEVRRFLDFIRQILPRQLTLAQS